MMVRIGQVCNDTFPKHVLACVLVIDAFICLFVNVEALEMHPAITPELPSAHVLTATEVMVSQCCSYCLPDGSG